MVLSSAYRIYSNKCCIRDKKVNKRRPQIRAGDPMGRLFEEFYNLKTTIKKVFNCTGKVEMSFLQKRVAVEGESEIWVEWRHHWKVQKEVNGDNEQTILLLAVIFFWTLGSYTVKLKGKISL